MVYTHYFRGWATINDELIEDVRRIIGNSEVLIVGKNGYQDPVLTEEELSFNGSIAAQENYGTFKLIHGVNRSESHCSTNAAPYDLIVCTVLLRVASRNARFKVRSDGTWDDGWLEARAYYQVLFNEEAVKPAEMR
jgi:hypothetical protein